MRTAEEAQGHFLYTTLNEIDQFDALRGKATSSSRLCALRSQSGNSCSDGPAWAHRVSPSASPSGSTGMHRPPSNWGSDIFSKVAHRRTYQPHQLLYHPGQKSVAEMPVYPANTTMPSEALRPVHRESVARRQVDRLCWGFRPVAEKVEG